MNAIKEMQKNLQTQHGKCSIKHHNAQSSADDKTQAGNNIRNSQPSYASRTFKEEFPKFDGTQSKEWLYKCEHFLSLDKTPHESKVRLVAMHLYGVALHWH